MSLTAKRDKATQHPLAADAAECDPAAARLKRNVMPATKISLI